MSASGAGDLEGLNIGVADVLGGFERVDLLGTVAEQLAIDVVVVFAKAAGWLPNTPRGVQHVPQHTGIVMGAGFGVRHRFEEASCAEMWISVGIGRGHDRSGGDASALQRGGSVAWRLLTRPVRQRLVQDILVA